MAFSMQQGDASVIQFTAAASQSIGIAYNSLTPVQQKSVVEDFTRQLRAAGGHPQGAMPTGAAFGAFKHFLQTNVASVLAPILHSADPTLAAALAVNDSTRFDQTRVSEAVSRVLAPVNYNALESCLTQLFAGDIHAAGQIYESSVRLAEQQSDRDRISTTKLMQAVTANFAPMITAMFPHANFTSAVGGFFPLGLLGGSDNETQGAGHFNNEEGNDSSAAGSEDDIAFDSRNRTPPPSHCSVCNQMLGKCSGCLVSTGSLLKSGAIGIFTAPTKTTPRNVIALVMTALTYVGTCLGIADYNWKQQISYATSSPASYDNSAQSFNEFMTTHGFSAMIKYFKNGQMENNGVIIFLHTFVLFFLVFFVISLFLCSRRRARRAPYNAVPGSDGGDF